MAHNRQVKCRQCGSTTRESQLGYDWDARKSCCPNCGSWRLWYPSGQDSYHDRRGNNLGRLSRSARDNDY